MSSCAAVSGIAWIDRLIGQRDAAREFLAGLGMTPQRNRDETNPMWRVPHWNGLFGDHDLVALAAHYGFEDRAATSPAARGAVPTAPGAGAICPGYRPGAVSVSEARHG
jgi:hypothetical protein